MLPVYNVGQIQCCRKLRFILSKKTRPNGYYFIAVKIFCNSINSHEGSAITSITSFFHGIRREEKRNISKCSFFIYLVNPLKSFFSFSNCLFNVEDLI